MDCRNGGIGSGKASEIVLMHVLEGYDGHKVYRFECPASLDEIGVWDVGGRAVDAAFSDLGSPGFGSDAGTSARKVVSVAIDSSVGTFWIGESRESGLRVGWLETRAEEIRRNCLMVNPGIDSLYPAWVKRKQSEPHDGNASSLTRRPLISIVTPLYNTPIAYFDEMVNSVRRQSYENWELILVNASPECESLRHAIAAVDDARVKVVELSENKGISENTVKGIEASEGDYIAFLDHDDIIEPNLLYEYVKAISGDPDIDLLYCDEDSITHDGARRFNPSLKFDLNLDLLLTHNYVCHMLAISRRAYDKVVPYDSTVDGAQDFDLTLRVSRVAKKTVRIPRVLYHWRQHAGSTNGGSTAVKPYVVDASIRAISGYLEDAGISAEVKPTGVPCVFEEEYPHPCKRDVSVAIVYDSPLQLFELLGSFSDRDLGIVDEFVVAGPRFDVADDVLLPLGVDMNGAEEGGMTVDVLISEMTGRPVQCVFFDGQHDFGEKADTAVKACSGDYCLLLRAETRFLPGCDAVAGLRAYLCRQDVGIVSAKAQAADGLVYHAGLCVKEDGSIGYLNQGFVEGMGGGYHGCAECACGYSAVDTICAMFRTDDYREVGGFRGGCEDALASSVDFSFKMRDLGKSVVVVPQAMVCVRPADGRWELGKDYLPEGSKAHAELWDAWGSKYRADVLSHPDIDLSSSYFRLKI